MLNATVVLELPPPNNSPEPVDLTYISDGMYTGTYIKPADISITENTAVLFEVLLAHDSVTTPEVVGGQVARSIMFPNTTVRGCLFSLFAPEWVWRLCCGWEGRLGEARVGLACLLRGNV